MIIESKTVNLNDPNLATQNGVEVYEHQGQSAFKPLHIAIEHEGGQMPSEGAAPNSGSRTPARRGWAK